uniref:Uncharacterized protein n=1 Tax=Glossina austeni TaxID=7395 RepID=A0A1A9VMK7_GLOAU
MNQNLVTSGRELASISHYKILKIFEAADNRGIENSSLTAVCDNRSIQLVYWLQGTSVGIARFEFGHWENNVRIAKVPIWAYFRGFTATSIIVTLSFYVTKMSVWLDDAISSQFRFSYSSSTTQVLQFLPKQLNHHPNFLFGCRHNCNVFEINRKISITIVAQ